MWGWICILLFLYLHFVFCIFHFVFVFVFCTTCCMIVPGKPAPDHIAQALLDALTKLMPWKYYDDCIVFCIGICILYHLLLTKLVPWEDYDGIWCRTQWFQHPPWQYDGNMISKCHPMSVLQRFAALYDCSLHIQKWPGELRRYAPTKV